MSVQQHDLHLLTGSYALDALPDGERAAFEKHLDRCPSCTEEVRGLRETAARLALATAVAPPPQLRDRVLAAVPHTRQLPPAPGRRRMAAAGERAGLRRLSTARSGLTAGILALAAAVAFLLVTTLSTNNQLQQAHNVNASIAAVLGAPDARLESLSVSGGGKVNSFVSLAKHEAVVTTADMPKPSGTRVYQLWVINSAGVARSMGLLTLTSADSTPALASGVLKGDKIGISIEPAGGSAKPTDVVALLPVKA